MRVMRESQSEPFRAPQFDCFHGQLPHDIAQTMSLPWCVRTGRRRSVSPNISNRTSGSPGFCRPRVFHRNRSRVNSETCCVIVAAFFGLHAGPHAFGETNPVDGAPRGSEVQGNAKHPQPECIPSHSPHGTAHPAPYPLFVAHVMRRQWHTKSAMDFLYWLGAIRPSSLLRDALGKFRDQFVLTMLGCCLANGIPGGGTQDVR